MALLQSLFVELQKERILDRDALERIFQMADESTSRHSDGGMRGAELIASFRDMAELIDRHHETRDPKPRSPS